MTIEQQDKTFQEILDSMNLERRATEPSEILVLGTWTGEEFDDLTERLAVLGYATKVQSPLHPTVKEIDEIISQGLEPEDTSLREPELGILGPHLWDYSRASKGDVVFVHLKVENGLGVLGTASPENLQRRWPNVI